MKNKRGLLFIIVTILVLGIISAESFSNDSITHAAVFYADYVDIFGEPPNVLVIDGMRIDLAQALYLFSSLIAGKEKTKLIDIQGYNDGFITTAKTELKRKDIIKVAKSYSKYLEEHRELPYLSKIRRLYISNSDSLYLFADFLRFYHLNEDYPQTLENKRLYLEHSIKWNHNLTESDARYVIFSIDHEGDRPVFSGDFDQNKQDIVVNSTNSIGVNPLFLDNICYTDFCTLPVGYKTENYTSEEVAWFSAVFDSSGDVIFPSCYPYCGVLEGTRIIIDDFILRYNFPMVWHFTGRSMIVLAIKEKGLLDEIKGLNKEGLLDLGIHTMYHSNMEDLQEDYVNDTIRENYMLFKNLFNITPMQFRSPYLVLAKDNFHLEVLSSMDIPADNEIHEIDRYCYGIDKCNYEYNLTTLNICRVDWRYNDIDYLFNIYLLHPWDFVFLTKGTPFHLEFSDTARKTVTKGWLMLIGKYGLIPITPKEVVEHEK